MYEDFQAGATVIASFEDGQGSVQDGLMGDLVQFTLLHTQAGNLGQALEGTLLEVILDTLGSLEAGSL